MNRQNKRNPDVETQRSEHASDQSEPELSFLQVARRKQAYLPVRQFQAKKVKVHVFL